MTSRMVAATSMLFAGSLAAGVDPLGIAVIAAACMVMLLVRSGPLLLVVSGAGGRVLFAPVPARLDRTANGAAESDCPVILTVIRR